MIMIMIMIINCYYYNPAEGGGGGGARGPAPDGGRAAGSPLPRGDINYIILYYIILYYIILLYTCRSGRSPARKTRYDWRADAAKW